MSNKQVGATGEQIASDFLRRIGYKIIDTNVRSKIGEIDILAQDRSTLVIVEVKAKRGTHQGSAIEMITPTKQYKLILLALELQNRYKTEEIRIDVIAIDGLGASNMRVKHHKAVVSGRL